MRYAARKDANHTEIVTALRMVGASVYVLDQKGIPDLLVGYRRATHLLEVKAPLGPQGGKSHSKLTPDQISFLEHWRGALPRIVRSIAEALKAIGCSADPVVIEAAVRSKL